MKRLIAPIVTDAWFLSEKPRRALPRRRNDPLIRESAFSDGTAARCSANDGSEQPPF